MPGLIPLKHNATYEDLCAVPDISDAYAETGVEWIWLIDPLERVLEVFRLENGRWVRIAAHTDDEVVRAEPFDAVEIDLLGLWGEDRAPAGESSPVPDR